MTFLNPIIFPYKSLLILMTVLFELAAIIGGIAFVIAIINPAKYEKTALNVLKESRAEFAFSEQKISSAEFFNAFVKLENLIRSYLKRHEFYLPSKGAPRMSFSFRQMVEALLQNEMINRQFYEELMQLNKYRNLVFHGHVEQADRTMLELVKKAIAKMEVLSQPGVL